MNLAIFGGTFDPIHSGHLRAAEVASRKFRLDRVLFIPTGRPPHKISEQLTAFEHRYAMVALACAGHPKFIPSLLEAPSAGEQPSYSIDTVRRLSRSLRSGDRLFFLVGADAFLDLPHWKDFRSLLDSADFIVISRPGVNVQAIRRVVPDKLLRPEIRERPGRIPLRRSMLYILEGVQIPWASRDIREAVRQGHWPAGSVAPLVKQYIRKQGLYEQGWARKG